MIAECQLQCLARKKHISRPTLSTLRLPVEAEDVEGKKGEKGKKKNSVTQKISQLPDPSQPRSQGSLLPALRSERGREGR